jgi:AraC-like DNA-binding protein
VNIGSARDQALPLRDLAARLGLSSLHFQHAFARRVGESPTAYAERIRHELAAARVKQ